jgi:hypothetical protein
MVKKSKIILRAREIGKTVPMHMDKILSWLRVFKYVDSSKFTIKSVLFKKFIKGLLFMSKYQYRLNVHSFYFKFLFNFFYIFPYYVYEKTIYLKEVDFYDQSDKFSDYDIIKFNKRSFFRKTMQGGNTVDCAGNYLFFFKKGNQFHEARLSEDVFYNDELFNKKYFDKTGILKGYFNLLLPKMAYIDRFNIFLIYFLSNLIELRRLFIHLLLICLYI